MFNRKTLSTILSLVLVLVMAFTLVGCGGSESTSGSGSGSGSNPKGVVNAFFDSISKHDAKKFLNCFEPDFREMILEEIDESDIKDELTYLDESLDEEYGSDWRKKVKVTDYEKLDSEDGVTYYEVYVEFEDEEEVITVLKIKSKYYIDESTFEDFM